MLLATDRLAPSSTCRRKCCWCRSSCVTVQVKRVKSCWASRVRMVAGVYVWRVSLEVGNMKVFHSTNKLSLVVVTFSISSEIYGMPHGIYSAIFNLSSVTSLYAGLGGGSGGGVVSLRH